MPSLVGMDLATAKSTARAAGFSAVSSHDTLRSRTQIVDGNWQVCSQDPAPGPAAAGTPLDLGVARTQESCPGGASTPDPSATPTSAAPLSSAPLSVSAVPLPAAPSPPAPPRTSAPERTVDPAPRESSGEPDDGGSGGGPVVRAGAFCDSPGAPGVTSAGTPMVCGPAKDGRNRWHGA